MIDILFLPFMQRALIAGFILGALLSVLGVFIVLKKLSFLSDGIAHASLAGVAIGILTNFNPLLSALGFAVLFGSFLAWLERKTKLSSDSIIGLLFTSGMALGVVLISFKNGYQPELVSFLFGNILSLGNNDLLIMVIIAVLIISFIALVYKKLVLLLISQDMAYIKQVPIKLFTTLLYIAVSVSVVLGVKLLGVILVSALLITPVSTAKLFAKSFKQLVIWSVVIAEITIFIGLILSLLLNLPTGAIIVLTGITIFFIVLVSQKTKYLFIR